jgi:8-oxoguanine deaminase
VFAEPAELELSMTSGACNPITGLMQCGPTWAWHTIVGGRFVVRDGEPVTVDLPRVLERHRRAAERLQQAAAMS